MEDADSGGGRRLDRIGDRQSRGEASVDGDHKGRLSLARELGCLVAELLRLEAMRIPFGKFEPQETEKPILPEVRWL